MGLYSSELDRIGMLAMDSLRAARLVVDTGLHARGWSRQTAIDFLLDNTPLERSIAEGDIDRYIAVPGQSTSYMVGRLEIDRLRSLAERHQPQRFSISAFHDVVLNAGMSPLYDVARRVEDWINVAITARSIARCAVRGGFMVHGVCPSLLAVMDQLVSRDWWALP